MVTGPSALARVVNHAGCPGPQPRQPQGLSPLAAAKINDPNGRRWQLPVKLTRQEFLPHDVPELYEAGLPVPFPGSEFDALRPRFRCMNHSTGIPVSMITNTSAW
jgi:hypothetical protein